MRFLTLGLTAATTAFLMTGGIASAQTKAAPENATPEKAQGAGVACARTTAPGSRDECVHQQKDGAASWTRSNSSSGMPGSSSGSSGSQSNTSIGSGNNIGGQNNTQHDNSRSNMTSGSKSSTGGSGGMSGSSADRNKR